MSDGPLSDPADQKARRQRAEDERIQREADIQAVMSTAAGRRFVWRLIDASGTFGSSFAGEAPLSMAFNEGRRAVGISSMQEAQRSDPEGYALMIQEQAAVMRQQPQQAEEES